MQFPASNVVRGVRASCRGTEELAWFPSSLPARLRAMETGRLLRRNDEAMEELLRLLGAAIAVGLHDEDGWRERQTEEERMDRKTDRQSFRCMRVILALISVLSWGVGGERSGRRKSAGALAYADV